MFALSGKKTNKSKLLAFVCVFAWATAQPTTAQQSKPFERVLVLGGGSINFVSRLGAYEALVDAGWKPDLIIATCGTALTAAIINAFPTAEERRNFVLSETFHNHMLQIKLEEEDFREFIGPIADMEELDYGEPLPNIFETHILSVPATFAKSPLVKPFSSENSPRIAIIGTRLAFGPEDVQDEDRTFSHGDKLTYVVFTDEDTATYLQNYVSPSSLLGNQLVRQQSVVVSDADVLTAARISLSDPYLVNPIEFDGHYYLTGAVELYPVNLGLFVGEQVFSAHPGQGFLFVEKWAFEHAFGFNIHAHMRQASALPADMWIDFTRGTAPSLAPKPKFHEGKMHFHVDEDIEVFRGIMSAQLAMGYGRGKEALAQKERFGMPGTRFHIRILNHNNASKRLQWVKKWHPRTSGEPPRNFPLIFSVDYHPYPYPYSNYPGNPPTWQLAFSDSKLSKIEAEQFCRAMRTQLPMETIFEDAAIITSGRLEKLIGAGLQEALPASKERRYFVRLGESGLSGYFQKNRIGIFDMQTKTVKELGESERAWTICLGV